MKRLMAMAPLALILGGCVTSLGPLDYKAQQQYVPVSLMLPAPYLRIQEQYQAELVDALKGTGAFSFLDGGYNPHGYSLQIKESQETPNLAIGIFGALSLLTLPLPYHYHDGLTGDIYHDGHLLKHYSYARDGYSVFAWYVPPKGTINKREMLGDLLRDMERDQVVPLVIAPAQTSITP
ncbi:hypothetical protein [Pseudomonas sp. TE3610]